MRITAFMLCLCWAGGAIGQKNSGLIKDSLGLFYYFGAQKIPLGSSSKHIYIQTSSQAAAVQLSAGLQSVSGVADFTISTLAVPTRQVLKLSSELAGDSALAWLRKQPGVEVARAAVYQQQGKDHLYEDAFYVRLKATTTTIMLQNEVAKRGCAIVKTYEYDKRVFLLSAGVAAQLDGLAMANAFYETGLFEYAEPDFRALTLLHNTPPVNDYLYPLQWGLKNTGIGEQFNGTPGADIGIEGAWQITKGSPSIRIAVIDEGVERTHPDLVNNLDPLGFGIAAAVATTGNVLADNRSHGTSCAGIIAAEANNNIGIAGVAPLCKIIPVNLTINAEGNFGTFAQLATCIDWAWNQGGADVLSNSWGGGVASSLMHDAIKRATTLGRGGKGAIVIFSAGNNDAGVHSPAIFPETIAVGAMDMCYQRKSINTCDAENFWGGNYGTGLDVSAPGVKIATLRNGATNTLTFNGTSAACPFVAGVAALILSVNNNYTQVQVREILERTSRKVGNYHYTRVPGQPNGSWSLQLGYGMVNAHQAVLAAQGFDFACKVRIAANGPTEFCTGGAVTLRVEDAVGAGIYSWLRNGQDLGFGQTTTASTTGSYQAVILRPGGCRDTSMPIQVRAASATGALLAHAGSDTAVCASFPHIMGGRPPASGGTAFHHPKRGMANNGAFNTFIRFDPAHPTTFYQTVKTNFNPSSNQFYVGAARTPLGLFMLSSTNAFVKVDTATGQVRTIGVAVPQSSFFSWQAMTYNPQQGKIYALASNFQINQMYEIDIRTGVASLLGTISGVNDVLLVWIAADANGDMYAMQTASAGSAMIYRIGINPLAATPLPSGTGFQAWYSQDAAFDPITGKLLLFAITRPIGSERDFPGLGLWEANKTTGTTALVGSVSEPFNWLEALAFAGPEYKYSWSPTTYLSNPNDANPVLSDAPPGNYTYTLTVTDLCGQTAQSSVTIRVKPVVTPNANGVLFVNAAATGNQSGNTWTNAVRTLRDAVNNSCHDVRQIWVARGSYTPSVSHRDSAFIMRNNLAIYGGFAGTETQLSQRNWRLNPTILSGDIGVVGNRSDNSHNVIFNNNNGLNATAILDGFIIRDGQANKNEYARSRGGGMFNLNSSPTVRNCIFVGNLASQYGGGVFNQGATATPTFINCVFSGNQALFGGGIYNESAQTQVFNSTFSSNQISGNGGGMYSYGTPKAVVRNSIVWGNAINGIFTATINNSTTIEVSHSIVQGGLAGTNIINQDPRFTSQAAIGLGQLGDLRLLICSPGLNVGNNAVVPAGTSTDLFGLSRIVGAAVDMGAYERQTSPVGFDIYVDATATAGTNEGTNWANAFTSLQAAINDMNLCPSISSPLIVHIAAGTYAFPATVPVEFNSLNVQILGGYPPGGGTRNATANPVIIRGNNVQVLKNATIDGVRVMR